MFDEITQEQALETIVRAAIKRQYDKGDHVTNARAFSDSVINQNLANDAAIPGSLRLAYNAAVKQLADGEPVRTNTAAYKPWHDDDEHPVATKTEADRWQRIAALIRTLPAEHELREAVRRHCVWTRPWDRENRKATPEEMAEAEIRAGADLEYLEHVAALNGLAEPEPGPLLVFAGIDDPLEPDDDDIPGYGDQT